MKYLYEYRSKQLIDSLLRQIEKHSKKPVRIMEVCGGHTMAIRKFGIHKLLPATIDLISGPGCPVCVTSRSFIDAVIQLSGEPDIIVATYGDLIRVPGSVSSLERERAKGADIRIVYSTLDALLMARQNTNKKIVFPAIGFETTTPPTALAVIEAKKQKPENFFVLSAHKTMPQAMEALIGGETKIDGYIGPGHVSTIAGAKIYQPLVKKFGMSVAISGFEPSDILQSILLLVLRLENNNPGIDIQYSRAVTFSGNLKAQQIVSMVFEPCDDSWRGLGTIPLSGMKLKKEFNRLNAAEMFKLTFRDLPEPKGCICGEILKGISKPNNCSLFRKSCTPQNPTGACMVSSEGACAAYYKYND